MEKFTFNFLVFQSLWYQVNGRNNKFLGIGHIELRTKPKVFPHTVAVSNSQKDVGIPTIPPVGLRQNPDE